MIRVLEIANDIVWGPPMLVLILGIGIYLSIQTGFGQVRMFPKALALFVKRMGNDRAKRFGISPYQALCTALAATVGTGNIAGVAGAIALGGPGAVFWMWISAILGMIIKFAEAALAVCFRSKQKNGDISAGPMYVIQNGIGSKWHWLAILYCFFGVVASFGVGNASQINAVMSGVNEVVLALDGRMTHLSKLILGLILAALVAVMLMGGAKKIGRIAAQLVPVASVFYIFLCVGVLIIKRDSINHAFQMILLGAFSPKAVTGGTIGSVILALRVGISRGIFTNEAGMGTAGIAHGAAQVDHPAEQGLLGIIEVFLDTIVICTLTALVILCSDVHIPYSSDVGATLTTKAFASIYGQWVCIPIAVALILFAIATILGWGLYGARCAQFLFGDHIWKRYVWAQVIVVLLGSLVNTGTVWVISEIFNGLMAVPNLIALIILSPQVVKLIRGYQGRKPYVVSVPPNEQQSGHLGS